MTSSLGRLDLENSGRPNWGWLRGAAMRKSAVRRGDRWAQWANSGHKWRQRNTSMKRENSCREVNKSCLLKASPNSVLKIYFTGFITDNFHWAWMMCLMICKLHYKFVKLKCNHNVEFIEVKLAIKSLEKRQFLVISKQPVISEAIVLIFCLTTTFKKSSHAQSES